MKINESLRQDTLYNLGAFDTIITEDENTVTIQRQTGYVDLNNLFWNWDSTRSYHYLDNALSEPLLPVDNNTKAELICNNISTETANTVYLGSNGIALGNTGTIYYKSSSTGSTMTPTGYIQYKLKSSYNETILKNQSVNILDNNGNNWLRNEWEKGLNIWNELYNNEIPISTSGIFTTSSTDIGSGFIPVKPSTVYTYNVQQSSNNKLAIKFYKSDKTPVQTTGWDVSDVASNTFATTTNTAYIYFRTVNYGGTYNNNIILSEGPQALPYQPYSGPIVHTNDIDKIISKNAEISLNSCSSLAEIYWRIIKQPNTVFTADIGSLDGDNNIKNVIPNPLFNYTRVTFIVETKRTNFLGVIKVTAIAAYASSMATCYIFKNQNGNVNDGIYRTEWQVMTA